MKMHVFAVFLVLLVSVVTHAQQQAEECLEHPSGSGMRERESEDIVVRRTKLWNFNKIPTVGFGCAAMKGELAKRSIRGALDAGFRHFDGAEAQEWYDDQALGSALREFLQDNPHVSREDIFLTTKLHPKNFGTENTRKAVEDMLDRLQVAYIDLLLIHFPQCGSWIPACKDASIEGTWQDSWTVLDELYRKSKIRALGLSNFNREELEQALMQVSIKPHVIQNWMDPFHQDKEVRALAKSKLIAYTAYSTLGDQWNHREPFEHNRVFESKVIQEIAQRNGMSVANVVLRWAMSHDVIVLPRSTNLDHIKENSLLNFISEDEKLLSPDEIAAIDALADD